MNVCVVLALVSDAPEIGDGTETFRRDVIWDVIDRHVAPERDGVRD
jgi:hypothetical protein